MIGRFPWEPFPPWTPEVGGADPLLTRIYRGAVEGADAYRGVRSAVRRDADVLRLGNRFLPDGRYREVAFVAVGHAATSMALAVLDVFGERVTQGFVAGPEPAPPSVPFHSTTLADGWGGAVEAPQVLEATREIAGGLRPNDLFLLLVSPGAVRGLLLPPAGTTAAAFANLLRTLHASGVRGRDVDAVARVCGDGGVGGRLLPAGLVADVQCLIVDRGGGAAAVGGGPTFPVTEAERSAVRSVLERAGVADQLPPPTGPDAPLPATSRFAARRPVVVAGPEDALRGAADAVVDKGWFARLGALNVADAPGATADRLLERSEEVLASERQGSDAPTKGIAVFVTSTLDLPEGVDERPACEAFLARARERTRRREMSVGLLRTAGPTGPAPAFAGAVIGAPGDPAANVPAGAARVLRMRTGITDVGTVAVALVPTAAGRPRSASR